MESEGGLYKPDKIREKEKSIDSKLSGIGFEVVRSNQCQLRCHHCYSQTSKNTTEFGKMMSGIRNSSMMSLEQVKGIVESGLELKVKEYYFIGAGETLLHPDIVEMLSFTRRRLDETFEGDGVIVVSTNGIKLTDKDFCEKITDTGAYILFHYLVDGVDEEAANVYSEITGISKELSGKYIKLLEISRQNLINLSKQKYRNLDRLFAQQCLTAAGARSGQTEKVFKKCVELGISAFFECVRTSPSYQRGGQNDLPVGELKQVYQRFVELSGNKEMRVSPPSFGNTCEMVKTGIHILADGTAIPCCGTYVPLGNVFKQSLEEIIDNPIRQFFVNFKDNIYGHCRDCNEFDYCKAGCKGNNYQTTGCFCASSPYCPNPNFDPHKLTRNDIIPDTCKGCLLEGLSYCNPRQEIRVYTRADEVKIL